MAATDTVLLDDAKAALGIEDGDEDLWLAGAIASVTEAVEAVTGRWLAPRSTTLYLDAGTDPWRLEVPVGVASLTYLGVASGDQPDNGTGTYTEVASAYYYLDPPAHERRLGAPAHRIALASSAPAVFPSSGQRRAVKATGVFGARSARASQIATAAVVRAYRAKTSGGADYAIVGPDGGMKILRDFAPAELEELRNGLGVPMVR